MKNIKLVSQTLKNKRIGIALGSGSARGWSHIGVIRELVQLGIEPDIVCGTSVGAVIGAFYVCGHLDKLESWGRQLSRRKIVQFMDIRLISRGGFIEGEKLIKFFSRFMGDKSIEDCQKRFGAVATSLTTGQEIWFTKGSFLDAIRASISLPGFLTPVKYGDDWLVDGGLVNPVPVSLCRALGAQLVISVNLNGERIGRNFNRNISKTDHSKQISDEANLINKITSGLKERISYRKDAVSGNPGLFDVLASFIHIMQDRITRSRMAGDPPDIILAPRLNHLALLDFNRAAEAIEEGRACVRRAMPLFQDMVEV